MKVILLRDVPKVGKKGDIVEVSDGYATNFLIKRNLAVAQNKSSLNDLNKQKEEARKLDLQMRENAMKQKEKINKIKIIFKEKAGKDGKLHHAITAKMIEEYLKNNHQIEIDKKNIKNFAPLKALGEAMFEIVLYKDITAKLQIEIQEQI